MRCWSEIPHGIPLTCSCPSMRQFISPGFALLGLLRMLNKISPPTIFNISHTPRRYSTPSLS